MNKNFIVLLISLVLLSSIGLTTSSLTPSAPIQDFQNLSLNSGWVTIANNLYWTSDSGQTWENITPPGQFSIRAVSFLDESSGFLVSSHSIEAGSKISFRLNSTTDIGNRWQSHEIVTLPLEDPEASVSSAEITFISPKIGWVLLKRMTSANFSVGSLYHTTDTGNSWKKIPIPQSGQLNFSDPSNGYLVGGPQQNFLYQTVDGGTRWNAYTSPLFHFSKVYLPNFISPSLGDFVSVEQHNAITHLRINRTEDFGRTWYSKSELPIPEIGSSFPLVSSIPGEIKILTHNRIITFWQTAEFFEVIERTSTQNIAAFDMINSQNGWAISFENQCADQSDPGSCLLSNSLLKTRDGGVSWSKVTTPSVQSLFTLETLSPSISPQGAPLLSRTRLHSGQGFDQCEISSLSDLQKWKNGSPYSAVNLYIGGKSRACSNQNLSPEFIRALSLQGWKFIPTWVGLQAACTTYTYQMSTDAGLAYTQGKDQAIDAARTARKYGLSFSDTDESGTVIYYDLEAFDITVPECLNAAKAFINGWTEELHSKGILSGVYGSVCASGLKEFYTLENKPDVIWPALWVDDVYSSDTDANDLPCVSNSMWGDHQRIFQYTGPHVETWGASSMYIDLNIIDGIVADISSVVGVPTPALENKSFESPALSPWKIDPDPLSCSWQITNQPNDARSGDKFLSLSKTNTQPDCIGVSQQLNITPIFGDTYRFSIWARSSTPSLTRSLRMGISGLGGDPESNDQKYSGIGSKWMCLEISHKINQSNLTGIQVQIQPEDSDGVQLNLDDAHLSLNSGPLCAQMLPPTGTTATDSAASDAVLIKWDNVPDATYYKVYRSPELSGEKTQIALVLDPQHLDHYGDFYETYYYWVKACNANSCSIFSPPDQGSFASPFLNFYDTFENGSLSKWIQVLNPDKISVCGSNPIRGSYSLCVNANTQTSSNTIHNLHNPTNTANLAFKIDPNSANLGTREYTILNAVDSALNKTAFAVILSQSDSLYRIRVEGQDNSGKYYSTKWFRINNNSTEIEVRWRSTIGSLRSTRTSGGFSLLINGIEKALLFSQTNNDLNIDQINFGAIVSQLSNGASGYFYLDDFSLDAPSFIRTFRP